jgi:adenylate kinase family enzyme
MYHARRPELEAPRRVIVIGSPGAEKGALARAISERLKIPCIELERLYWRPGWQKPASDEWRAQVTELAAREDWVMEGTFPSTLDIRVARADWLVYIDAPMPVCLIRKLKEMTRGRRDPKAEVAPGCPQRFNGRLLRFIWHFPTSIGPRINTIIARERRNRTIFILRTKREMDDFLAKVPILGDLGRDQAGSQPEG